MGSTGLPGPIWPKAGSTPGHIYKVWLIKSNPSLSKKKKTSGLVSSIISLHKKSSIISTSGKLWVVRVKKKTFKQGK